MGVGEPNQHQSIYDGQWALHESNGIMSVIVLKLLRMFICMSDPIMIGQVKELCGSFKYIYEGCVLTRFSAVGLSAWSPYKTEALGKDFSA